MTKLLGENMSMRCKPMHISSRHNELADPNRSLSYRAERKKRHSTIKNRLIKMKYNWRRRNRGVYFYVAAHFPVSNNVLCEYNIN